MTAVSHFLVILSLGKHTLFVLESLFVTVVALRECVGMQLTAYKKG